VPEHRRAAGQRSGNVTRRERATRAGTKPFATSSKMTGIPYRGPNVRQTFVAPMFPLPTVRMSTPFVQRTTQ
jgi:hypothetical protein